MFLALKLVALAVACLVFVGPPIIIALVYVGRVTKRAPKTGVNADTVSTVAAASTVMAFLVALTFFGWPDNTWLEPDPLEPGRVGIRWNRDGMAAPTPSEGPATPKPK